MGNHVFAGLLLNIEERKSKKYDKAAVVTIQVPSKNDGVPIKYEIWFFDTETKNDASYALSKTNLIGIPAILIAKDGTKGGYIGIEGPKRFGLIRIPAELREAKPEDVDAFYKSLYDYRDAKKLPPDYTVNHKYISDLIDLYEIVKKTPEEDALVKKLRSNLLKLYSGDRYAYLGYVASVGKNSSARTEMAVEVKINKTEYIKVVFWNEKVSEQAALKIRKGDTILLLKMQEREPYRNKRQFAAEDFLMIEKLKEEDTF